MPPHNWFQIRDRQLFGDHQIAFDLADHVLGHPAGQKGMLVPLSAHHQALAANKTVAGGRSRHPPRHPTRHRELPRRHLAWLPRPLQLTGHREQVKWISYWGPVTTRAVTCRTITFRIAHRPSSEHLKPPRVPQFVIVKRMRMLGSPVGPLLAGRSADDHDSAKPSQRRPSSERPQIPEELGLG